MDLIPPQPLTLAFRPATAADIPAIVALVNSAYRGDSSRAGWTTEADLLGGQRTDAEEVASLLAAADSGLLLAWRGDELVGSVHLQKAGADACLGMLAVRPTLQGAGIGKALMAEAEQRVREQWQAARILMTVITLRPELIAFYERRGYRRTGVLKPFPDSERFGIPRVDGLALEVLEKLLD